MATCEQIWHELEIHEWHELDFHWAPRVIEIGALQVPWKSTEYFLLNLMESLVSSKLWVFNLGRISSNFEFTNFDNNYLQFCRMNKFP